MRDSFDDGDDDCDDDDDDYDKYDVHESFLTVIQKIDSYRTTLRLHSNVHPSISVCDSDDRGYRYRDVGCVLRVSNMGTR